MADWAGLAPTACVIKKIGHTRCLCGRNHLSISETATTAGRHLIGRRWPPPDDGHIPPGAPDFGYSTPTKYPNIKPPCPKRLGCSDHNGPTVSTSSRLSLPTKTDKNHLLDLHALLPVFYHGRRRIITHHLLAARMVKHARTFIH